jgi:hypothetical protein
MILRTELRRSSAPVIGAGLLVISLGLIHLLPGPWHKGTAQWNEQWTGLAQWTRSLSMFLWPLVLAAGAWQGLRDHRSRVTELFATTARPAWRRVLPTAGALAVALAGAYALLLVVGGVQVAGTASYFHLKWLPVAGVMVLALTGIALLGFGLGGLVPSLITPPVLAAAALAGQIAVLQRDWPMLLTPAFEGREISVFSMVSTRVTLAQALWFAGIGATGYCLLVAARARTRLAALLPVAVAAAVTLPVLSGVGSPVVADAGARELVCDDDGPRVCVRRAHAGYLPTLTGPAREALALLGKLPSPPTSVVEAVPDDGLRPPRRDEVAVFAGGHGFGGRTPLLTDPAEVLLNVLATASAPTCAEDGDWDAERRTVTARTVTAAWFTGELRPLPTYGYTWDTDRAAAERTWRGLRALPAAEQRARVAAVRAAGLACHRDLLSVLGTP